MRIAQISPLYESVPPKFYGGSERVISYLTDALVDLGYDVTLFASGDSQTKAKLVPICNQALRLNVKDYNINIENILQLKMLADRIQSFDIVHYHTDFFHFLYSKQQHVTHLTTLHGRLNLPGLKRLYHVFHDMPVISISNAQRQPLPQANWMGTIYHGLPVNLYQPNFNPQSYLAFIGRLSPEKRPDRAITIARLCGRKLKIAAKIDKNDQAYFDQTIAPLLKQPHVEFIGEIGDHEKQNFLGQASALLFPIDWPEPFGMVMIEAMACATPVIAYNHGSVPEVIDHNQSGYIVHSMTEALDSIRRLDQLDRRKIRDIFVQRFSVERMAHDYIRQYKQVIERSNSFFKKSVINANISNRLGEDHYYGS